MQLGEQAEEALAGPDQLAWLDQLDQELENIRIALSWALETDIEAGLHLASALWRFWEFSYVTEGEAWFSQLLVQAKNVEPTIKAKALWVQSGLYSSLQKPDLARVLVEQSLALYRELGDQHGIARCLGSLGSQSKDHESFYTDCLAIFKALGDKLGLAETLHQVGFDKGKNYQQGMRYLLESESLYRELGHLAGIYACISSIVNIAIWHEDYETAGSRVEEILTIQELMGARSWSNTPGVYYYRLGEFERARDFLEKKLMTFQRSGDKFWDTWTSVQLGYVLLRMSEIEQARKILTECQQVFKKGGSTTGVVFATEGLASLALNQGQAQKATRLFGWADATRLETQDTRPPVEQADVDRDIAAITAMIGEAAYAAAYAAGQAMTMDEAIALAVSGE